MEYHWLIHQQQCNSLCWSINAKSLTAALITTIRQLVLRHQCNIVGCGSYAALLVKASMQHHWPMLQYNIFGRSIYAWSSTRYQYNNNHPGSNDPPSSWISSSVYRLDRALNSILLLSRSSMHVQTYFDWHKCNSDKSPNSLWYLGTQLITLCKWWVCSWWQFDGHQRLMSIGHWHG